MFLLCAADVKAARPWSWSRVQLNGGVATKSPTLDRGLLAGEGRTVG